MNYGILHLPIFGRKLSNAEKALVLDFTYLVTESRRGSFRLEIFHDN